MAARLPLTTDQDASRHHEQHLLRLNQLSSSSREDTLSSPPPVTNVQQGLTLLHSVRFISQTRQRNQFVPFVLHNSTGVPLQFSTLTSLPAKVLFNPTAILQQRTQSSTSMESMQPLSWETVRPGEEMPFDFASGRKLRHQVCREVVSAHWMPGTCMWSACYKPGTCMCQHVISLVHACGLHVISTCMWSACYKPGTGMWSACCVCLSLQGFAEFLQRTVKTEIKRWPIKTRDYKTHVTTREFDWPTSFPVLIARCKNSAKPCMAMLCLHHRIFFHYIQA